MCFPAQLVWCHTNPICTFTDAKSLSSPRHACSVACSRPQHLPLPALHLLLLPAAASSFNLGNTATLYLAVDTSSLNSITGTTYTPGTTTSLNSLVRISPPDQAPPTSPPGVTISQTTTYNYNLIISRLLTCVNERSVSAPTDSRTPLGCHIHMGATRLKKPCEVRYFVAPPALL